MTLRHAIAIALVLAGGLSHAPGKLSSRPRSTIAGQWSLATPVLAQAGSLPSATSRDIRFVVTDAVSEGNVLTVRLTLTNTGVDRAVEIASAEILDDRGNSYTASSVSIGVRNGSELLNGATLEAVVRFERLPLVNGLLDFGRIVRLTLTVRSGNRPDLGASLAVQMFNIDVARRPAVTAPTTTVRVEPPKPDPLLQDPRKPEVPTPRQVPTEASKGPVVWPPPTSKRTGACAESLPTPMVAVDGDVAIWIRADGTVVEQRLPAQNDARTTAAPVRGIAAARGVAIVQVVTSGATTRQILGGLATFESTGLEMRTARVALLADGGLAIWNAEHHVTTYARKQLQAVLHASALTIADGHFILSDGTVEDGVIERLVADPQVLAGIVRGLGSARCDAVFGCHVIPRTAKPLPSFKYPWFRTATAAKCVASVAGGGVLMQDGKLRMNVFGSVANELAADVVDFSIGLTAIAFVTRDGSLWYAQTISRNGKWDSLTPIPGVTNARRVWVANQDAILAVGNDWYAGGVWFVNANGDTFRWVEDAPEQVDSAGNVTVAANPVLIPAVSGTVDIAADGSLTVFRLQSNELVAWMPERTWQDRSGDEKSGLFLHLAP